MYAFYPYTFRLLPTAFISPFWNSGSPILLLTLPVKEIGQSKNEKSSLWQLIIHYKPASAHLWVNCLLWTVLQLLGFMLFPYKPEIGIFITSGHNLNYMSPTPWCRLVYCHVVQLLFWHTTMQLTHELYHQWTCDRNRKDKHTQY